MKGPSAVWPRSIFGRNRFNISLVSLVGMNTTESRKSKKTKEKQSTYEIIFPHANLNNHIPDTSPRTCCLEILPWRNDLSYFASISFGMKCTGVVIKRLSLMEPKAYSFTWPYQKFLFRPAPLYQTRACLNDIANGLLLRYCSRTILKIKARHRPSCIRIRRDWGPRRANYPRNITKPLPWWCRINPPWVNAASSK